MYPSLLASCWDLLHVLIRLLLFLSAFMDARALVVPLEHSPSVSLKSLFHKCKVIILQYKNIGNK